MGAVITSLLGNRDPLYMLCVKPLINIPEIPPALPCVNSSFPGLIFVPQKDTIFNSLCLLNNPKNFLFKSPKLDTNVLPMY